MDGWPQDWIRQCK